MMLNPTMGMDESDGPITATLNLVAGEGVPPGMTKIHLRGNLVTFGRAVNNRVVLESLQISRHHASLEYRVDKWFLKDLSTNGIQINHRSYPKNDWMELQDMDVIQFIPTGSLQYRIRYTFARIPPSISTHVNPQVPVISNSQGALSFHSTPPNSSLQNLADQINLDIEDSDSNESISLLSGAMQDDIFEIPGQFETSTPICESAVTKRKLCDIIKSEGAESKKRNCNNLSSNGIEEEEELLELDEEDSPFIKIMKAIQTPPEHKREQIIKSPYKSPVKNKDPEARIEEIQLELDYMTGKCKRLEEEKTTEKISYQRIINELRSEKECYKQEFYKKVIGLLEQDFSCSICSEVFIEATVTDCGHTFCQFCIGEWTKKKTDCPICRKMVTNQAKHIEIENFLTKIHDLMPAEIKVRRIQSLKDRDEQLLKTKESEKRSRNANDYGFAPDRFVDFLAELQHINDMFGGQRGHFGNQASAGVPPGIAAAAAATRNAVTASVRRQSARMRNRVGNINVQVAQTHAPNPAGFLDPAPVIQPNRRGRPRGNRTAHNVNPFPQIQQIPNVYQINPGPRNHTTPRVITIDDSAVDPGLPQIVPEPQPGPSRMLNC